MVSANLTDDVARAGRREWLGLAVLVLPCLLYAMDLTVLNLALPALSADLKPSAAQLLWIVDIYGFVLASLLITMGALGDRVGRRRLLLVGAGAFGVTSILAACADTAGELIAARAALGVAGATLAPATLSLIRNMFHDAQERTIAVGIWVASYSLGGAIGPIVGGILLEYFWWGSVFLVGVPLMLLLLVLGPVLLPEYRDPNPGRLDVVSAALSLGAVLASIFGLKRLAEHGFSWTAVLSVIAGMAIGWHFVRRQSRLDAPLIDLKLLRARRFSIALGCYAVVSFVAFGASVFVAQYLQLVAGLDPFEAALWSVPMSLAFVAGSTLVAPIARRVARVSLMIASLIVAAVGFVLLGAIGVSTAPAVVALVCSVYALGLAPVFAVTNELIIGSAPPQQAGAASAISESGSELGAALGIALLGSVGAAVYRIGLSEVPGTRYVGATLGAAVDAAQRIGGESGALLLEASRAAFVQGLRAAAVVSAILLVAAAVLVGRERDPPAARR